MTTANRPSFADAPARRATTIGVVDSQPVADIGRVSLLRLAAAAPADSTDPVDIALRRALGSAPEGTVASFDPATPERRYSLAALRGTRLLGENADVAVMRGDVESVLADAAGTRQEIKEVRAGVKAMRKLGRRCLAVAAAPLDGDTTGEFRLKGFVVLGVGERSASFASPRPGYAKVHVWPAALRFQHWANLLLIITLTLTGYYIMDPYWASDTAHDVGFLMGWIRLAHYIAGASWIVLALWRLAITVFARQRQMRWRSLWPLYSKDDVKDMFATISFYLMLRKEEPAHVGHNALQQITYTGIYGLCIIQIFTGLALWGLPMQDNWFWMLLSYPVHWFGVAGIRLIHALIMFIIWAFVIIHVYLVFRADAVEGHGGLSAMISGHMWLPVGTRPHGAPEVE